ncbi:hypothetical protein CDAR_496631 [Caerostris darwini]|uniref:Uncharacterized protein n=1 Tax=Caerostris darwini TaxID=1538125 RepID=A0AAV4MWY1_9ARAC|nr:hypothetical protein CDAR_496631 [Caerostris darwini]
MELNKHGFNKTNRLALRTCLHDILLSSRDKCECFGVAICSNHGLANEVWQSSENVNKRAADCGFQHSNQRSSRVLADYHGKLPFN